MWDEAITAAVVDGDVVDAVGVEYAKIGMGGDRVSATHTGVVELDTKADGLEGGLHEVSPSPHLRQVTSI